MNKLLNVISITASLYALNMPTAQAEQYAVTVTNLTRGQIFSPIFAASHDNGMRLFTVGESASPELAALAQDADTSGLYGVLSASPSVHDIVIGSDAIPPGHSETLMIQSHGNQRYLSLASMLVTTNDGFIAVNSLRLPPAHAVLSVPAYDAGAEANDEACAYIPGPPCGHPFSASAEPGEGFIHIHAGIQGGGDLNPAEFDWRNPVARIEVRLTKQSD